GCHKKRCGRRGALFCNVSVYEFRVLLRGPGMTEECPLLEMPLPDQARRKLMPHFLRIEACSMACIWPFSRASSAVLALSPPTKKAAGQKTTMAAVVATASLVRCESWTPAAAAAALLIRSASWLSSRQLYLS